MKLSERSIRIKSLISGQVDMGTFGLVELELIEFDKQIEELSKLHQPTVMKNEVAVCKHHKTCCYPRDSGETCLPQKGCFE